MYVLKVEYSTSKGDGRVSVDERMSVDDRVSGWQGVGG